MKRVQQTGCRRCGAPIIWMVTRNGKNIPVDPDDVDEGEIEWVENSRGEQAPLFDYATHRAHFDTCDGN